MRAAVIPQYGDADVLQVVDHPQPTPQANDILVRVGAAAINPKDTFIRKGRFKQFTGTRFPLLTGFDFAGEIAAIGANVTDWQSGDAVYGMLDGWQGGTVAEYVAIPAATIAKRPTTITVEEAAAIPLVGLTALQALRDDGQLKSGQRVCINGASGGVGSMAVQIAKAMGAHITTITSAANKDFCASLGADVTLDYAVDDIHQARDRYDVFFDVFGNHRFSDIKPILTQHGRFVSTVLRRHVIVSQLLTRWFSDKKARLVVVKSVAEDLATLAAWVDSGAIQPIVQAVYPLDDIAEAHRQQQSKHTRGKLVIRI